MSCTSNRLVLIVLAFAGGMLLLDRSVSAEADNCVVFHGLDHCPVGQALLQFDGDNLIISNIGSSGEDGVAILIPPTLEVFDVRTLSLGDPADPKNPIPDGAAIEVTARGTIGGVPDQVITVAHYEDTGAQVTGTLDFSALAPTSLFAEHFCKGALIHQEPIASSTATYLLDIWPDSFSISWIDIDVDWKFSCHPVTTPGGVDIAPDLIVVDAVDPANPHSGYSRMILTAKDIPTITMIGETLVPPQSGPAVSEWGLIVVTLLAMTLGTIMLARRRENRVAETG